MKDLTVLKKLLILFSLIGATTCLGADELQNYLSDEKNLIFDFQRQQSDMQSNVLQNSWISPVTLSYEKDWKPMTGKPTLKTEAFSIGIDQPIFKGGGIYFGIRYAQAVRGANAKEIALQKRQMIAQAAEILYSYHKTKLQRQKLNLLVANGAIAIKRQEEMYKAGMIDSTVLNQTILAHNRDAAQKLDMDLALRQLRANFAFLSDKNPNKIRLPKLKMLSLKQYKKNNLKLAAEQLHAMEQHYSSKMTWTKYLPTVSVYARYRYSDEKRPGTMKGYENYGLRVTMPLSVNAPADIEANRLAYLVSQVKVRDQFKILYTEYRLVKASLHILDRKITLAKKDEALYRRLLKSTRNLAKAGEKTELDIQTMRNSLAIKKLDRRIYYLEKQIQLLKLYAKVAH
jgi:outer membrane protein TolC